MNSKPELRIELDPELFRRYCVSIPVLELDGGTTHDGESMAIIE